MDEYSDLFFRLLEYIKRKEEDKDLDPSEQYDDPTLPDKLKQIAYSERSKVSSFFNTVLDQYPYFTNDHIRFRRFLLEWYATHRSIITKSKKSLDPYNLPEDEQDEMIRSMGFPYPDKVISEQKAQFILNLVNLYKKRGTPTVFVSALQSFFGLSNVILSEWWLKRNSIGEFVFSSKPIVPKNLTDPTLFMNMNYETFVSGDPLWHLTLADVTNLYNTEAITLPSITPYISIQAAIQTDNLIPILSIVSRELQECYDYWNLHGDVIACQNVTLRTMLTGIYSILEVCLAISYVFNKTSDSVDNEFCFYNGSNSPLDPDGSGTTDPEKYDMVIDEWNNVNIRPTSKAHKEALLLSRRLKFTDTTGSQTVVPVMRDPGTYLNLINPALKEEIDDLLALDIGLPTTAVTTRSKLLEALMLDFEWHLIHVEGTLNFPLTYVTLGNNINEELTDVMNFFKPYRVRIRKFITTYLLQDPVGDSQLEEDICVSGIKQTFVDKGPEVNLHCGLDQGVVCDNFLGSISQTISDELRDTFDSNIKDVVTIVANPPLAYEIIING